ncbi:uncharacterized protein LAESUDRAFT_419855 [Laetiporus sulphureus 93-53]|uniref:C2H2-type domain-containing protein n=1 Tax=Laetiporus sulphureus 93-53 TaxID=1314785 RepID=A0A165GG56_9APHY|nr:uncharacterized protein LAESUDRAFT_419855 [Laetiporus sulphureus 93-53]KZT10302.1 hypothetical protein LAESUDRAFT_419855 [Laetiporus sulphureus 93-53]
MDPSSSYWHTSNLSRIHEQDRDDRQDASSEPRPPRADAPPPTISQNSLALCLPSQMAFQEHRSEAAFQAVADVGPSHQSLMQEVYGVAHAHISTADLMPPHYPYVTPHNVHATYREVTYRSLDAFSYQSGSTATFIDPDARHQATIVMPDFNRSPTAHSIQLNPDVSHLRPILGPISLSSDPRSALQCQTVKCKWGGNCDIELDDLTPTGINRHLKDHHYYPSEWDARCRGACQWQGSPCSSVPDMYYSSFGKHIAAVHLGSTARTCPHCNAIFSRADTLSRHVERYCPKRPH